MMNIPISMKKGMSKYFYDKDIEIYTLGVATDAEGCTYETGKQTLLQTIKGNFHFKTVEKIQEEYGKDIIADAVITCNSTIAKEGNIVNYNSQDYDIVGIIPSDSHCTLLVHRVGVLNE